MGMGKNISLNIRRPGRYLWWGAGPLGAGNWGQNGEMKMETQSDLITRQEQQVLELLGGQTIGFAMGNRFLLTCLSRVPVFRGKTAWAVTTEREALQEAALSPPDLLLLTDELEQGYGPALIGKLKDHSPKTRALIFLSRETSDVVQECLEAGAVGVCFQSNITDGQGDFIKSLKALAANAIYYPEEVREKAGYVGSNPYRLVLPLDLTEREKEVMVGLSEGLTNKEISETLFISGETVKSHLKNITSKLGVRDRTAAAIYALRAGINKGQLNKDVQGV